MTELIQMGGSPWSGLLVLPAYGACASAFVLIIQSLRHHHVHRKQSKQVSPPRSPDVSSSRGGHGTTTMHGLVVDHGGHIIYGFRCLRCLATLLTGSLGLVSLYGVDHSTTDLQVRRALLLALVYASILALYSIFARPSHSQSATHHLNFILLVALGVYAYRDVWPLLTYTLTPADGAEGWILWARIGALTVGGVVVPLFVPRQYVPVDSESPMPEPNPEQTCCLFSFLLHFYLDPVVFKASRLPHLPFDELPPLADDDQTRNLVNFSFPMLDRFSGAKRRHVAWDILNVFRVDYCLMSLAIVLRGLVGFVAPIGLNRLLHYMETGGRGEVVRPGVWIAWLLIGPIARGVFGQLYTYYATRVLVRQDSVITQLVFEHALRIRLAADTDDHASSAPEVSSAGEDDGPGTSDEASAEAVHTPEDELTASTKGKPVPSKPGSIAKQEGTETPTSQRAVIAPASPVVVGKKPGQSVSKAGNLVGRINNLVTADLSNFNCDLLLVFLQAPLEFGISMFLLYSILGWSVFVGLAVVIGVFLLSLRIATKIRGLQKEKMKRTDSRLQIVVEMLNVMRMVKILGWEAKVNDRIAEAREDELQWLWKLRLFDLLNTNVNYLLPLLHMITTYLTFTLIMKQELSASIVFSTMAIFNIMREQVFGIFRNTPVIIQAKVSADRLNDFLYNTELIDGFTDVPLETSTVPSRDMLGFRDASFAWSMARKNTPRSFRLRIKDELAFKTGKVNVIIGPTGSGKTSMLMALLGEMHFIPDHPEAWVNLPRNKGVAYAAQESWVQNDTIKGNILFGARMDEQRYNKVISQCALTRDLDIFESGDETYVGEKGLTLSGGQKARVTLARAVYSSAEILLLDDVFAALDVHTSKWIVDKLFRSNSSLLVGRTVLLVTHNVAIASLIADFVVSLGSGGRILSQGSISDALAKNRTLDAELAKKRQALAEDELNAQSEDVHIAKKPAGKLFQAEEIQRGSAGWPALKLYSSAAGGRLPVISWSGIFLAYIVSELANTMQTWFLGYWASQYDRVADPQQVNVAYYLVVIILILAFGLVCYAAGFSLYTLGQLRASRIMHQRLIKSVFGTALRWLDVTPTARIVTRCTQDIRAVDGPLPNSLSATIEKTIQMLIKFGAVIVLTPAFILPGVLVAGAGYYVGQFYLKAQLSAKREASNARSPVLAHVGAAIIGLTSVRAYGSQEAFKTELFARIDRYSRANRICYNLNRWVGVRMEALGGLFAGSLAAYMLYWQKSDNAANAGFSLAMAVGFSSVILWWVRASNAFEVDANSLERIQGYIEIEQEPKPMQSGIPPAYWPASGEIVVDNLCAQYSKTGPLVLKNVNFRVKSGERVGIVGRTGSGKSSLTLALLRCIVTSGMVYYDGIPISSINLDALRSNITTIPQTPELLSGTIRQNLDPFSQYDDATLNEALRTSGLFSLQHESQDGRLTLDSVISSGGGNLSVGQRQILALARAIVRQSKLLILDEATSAIDDETDNVIQTSLRRELQSDVTVITVAHRLKTVMDADKIMVLDAGELKEFASPADLLKDEKSFFRSLVDESSDKAELYAIASAAAAAEI